MDLKRNRLPRLPAGEFAARLMMLFIAAYGLLYYSYKFFSPTILDGDSSYYYPMYQAPLQWHVAQSPFVLRQVGAVLTYLAWRSHLFFPDSIAFHDANYDQHIFFAALLVNWVCLVLTAFVAGLLAEHLLGVRKLLVFLAAALLCFLSFHSQIAVITDLAEGPAWLLMAIAMLAFVRRAPVWLLVTLVLAVFQREMILLAVGFLAAMECFAMEDTPWRVPRRFAIVAFVSSVLCFAVYIVLRRWLGGGWSFQSHPGSLIEGMFRITFDRRLFLQVLLSQNVIFIALGAFCLARRGPMVVRYWMPRLLAAFAFLALVSLASYEYTTTGRLAGILTPAFAALAAVSLYSLQEPVVEGRTGALPRGTNTVPNACIVASAVLLLLSGAFQRIHTRAKKHHPPVVPQAILVLPRVEVPAA